MDFQWTEELEEILLQMWRDREALYNISLTAYNQGQIDVRIFFTRLDVTVSNLMKLCAMHFYRTFFFAYVVPYIGFDWGRIERILS